MENWLRIIKLVNTWQHTKRIPGTSIQEDERIFTKELNDTFILLERNDVHEIIFKPKVNPPDGIIP